MSKEIKVVNEPSVYLASRQEVAQSEIDRFLTDHGVTWETDTEVGSEALCETAGRVCYMSFSKPRPGGNAAYLSHIKEVGHGSVLEHACWSLIFTGISRSLSHELVRHRSGWGYSQLSQRYVDESVAEYVVPPDLQVEVECARLRRDQAANDVGYALEHYPRAVANNTEDFDLLADVGERWLQSVEHAHADYVWLSGYLSHKASTERPDLPKTEARKYARQAARSVLPNATETKIFVTVNARAARHFFEMRASRFADPEIRKLAYAMWQVLVREAPALFGDYEKVALPDGTTELTTKHRKI